jgi:hypothetical protein
VYQRLFCGEVFIFPVNHWVAPINKSDRKRPCESACAVGKWGLGDGSSLAVYAGRAFIELLMRRSATPSPA